MAKSSTALATKEAPGSVFQLDSSQTLRASTALLRKIQSDEEAQKETAKPNLLDDADDADEAEDDTPIWLVLSTKKHIVDKKRLKPGKISLPHPVLSAEKEGLRICLITADPQRRYKDLIAQQGFPLELAVKVKRVIGLEKLKSRYKSYESRRQLLGEYDVFLADDRVITYLPQLLGKVFYKGGSKRPVPVSLEGKRQNVDEQGVKRRKLAEGGSKVVKDEVKPEDFAQEVQKTLASALVHLAPSTTTAVKVGVASQTPEQVQANVEAVVAGLVEKYVPQQWKNVRSIHIKGPDTAALPIWMTQELWQDEQDVLEETPKANEGKKRKRGALTEVDENGTEFIEVPGPDGKMRRVEKPAPAPKQAKQKYVTPVAKRMRKSQSSEELNAKAIEKAEKSARKEALKKQKEAARADAAPISKAKEDVSETDGKEKKKSKKAKSKA